MRLQRAKRYTRLAMRSLAGKASHRPRVRYSLSAAPQHVVPDAQTAESVAEAVLLPVYGPVIFKERPFQAQLEGNLWAVWGRQSSFFSRRSVAVVRMHRTDAHIHFLGLGR